MGTANVRNVKYTQGRLVKGPTDATAAFPHGGTALGLFGWIQFRLMPVRGEVTAEEYHGQIVEVIEGAENVLIGATLREWDDDAISTIFPSTTAESGADITSVSRTYTTTRGALGTDRAVKLLFSPDNPEHHEALVIYRAIPLLEETTQVRMHLSEEFGIPVIFLGLPDSSGRLYEWNRLESLAL